MLFTFPSRYWFAIGLTRVFSLAGWSRRIRAGFLVSRVTQDAAMPRYASPTGLSPSAARLSSRSGSRIVYNVAVLQPRGRVATLPVWALPRSLATTRGIIVYFLFLGVLRCFSSPRLPSYLCRNNSPSDCLVVPFGNPWIKDYLHLPRAYRSLSRPSSPPRAKASTRRPNLLSPIYIKH